MENNSLLLCETASVSELTARAVRAVVNGDIDPITAHVNISRMEAAIKAFKDNEEIRDITLRELSKYGKSHQFGDCRLEEAEVGVKYDYANCGDSKERETMLRQLPVSGLADPQTGEMLYPPVRSSKTSIKTTFKKQP